MTAICIDVTALYVTLASPVPDAPTSPGSYGPSKQIAPAAIGTAMSLTACPNTVSVVMIVMLCELASPFFTYRNVLFVGENVSPPPLQAVSVGTSPDWLRVWVARVAIAQSPSSSGFSSDFSSGSVSGSPSAGKITAFACSGDGFATGSGTDTTSPTTGFGPSTTTHRTPGGGVADSNVLPPETTVLS